MHCLGSATFFTKLQLIFWYLLINEYEFVRRLMVVSVYSYYFSFFIFGKLLLQNINHVLLDFEVIGFHCFILQHWHRYLLGCSQTKVFYAQGTCIFQAIHVQMGVPHFDFSLT